MKFMSFFIKLRIYLCCYSISGDFFVYSFWKSKRTNGSSDFYNIFITDSYLSVPSFYFTNTFASSPLAGETGFFELKIAFPSNVKYFDYLELFY